MLAKLQVLLIGTNSLFGRVSSLLLKQSPVIKRLDLYDDKEISTAFDVSRINTQCKVRAYRGREQLPSALKNADLVLIGDVTINGAPSEQFPEQMVPKVTEYARAYAAHSPQAILVVAASPVNTMVPVITRTLMDSGCYDCNRVLGCTSVDNVRANAILSQHLEVDPRRVVLPVVGGSSPDTRVPLFSHAKPGVNLSRETEQRIVRDVKTSGSRVYAAKKEPEAINKAYATVRFVHSVMAGLRGEPDIAEIALSRSVSVPGVDYFSLPLLLGKNGIEHRFGLPKTTGYESRMIERAIEAMSQDTEAAYELARAYGTRSWENKMKKKVREKDVYVLLENKPEMNFPPKPDYCDHRSQPRCYYVRSVRRETPSIPCSSVYIEPIGQFDWFLQNLTPGDINSQKAFPVFPWAFPFIEEKCESTEPDPRAPKPLGIEKPSVRCSDNPPPPSEKPCPCPLPDCDPCYHPRVPRGGGCPVPLKKPPKPGPRPRCPPSYPRRVDREGDQICPTPKCRIDSDPTKSTSKCASKTDIRSQECPPPPCPCPPPCPPLPPPSCPPPCPPRSPPPCPPPCPPSPPPCPTCPPPCPPRCPQPPYMPPARPQPPYMPPARPPPIRCPPSCPPPKICSTEPNTDLGNPETDRTETRIAAITRDYDPHPTIGRKDKSNGDRKLAERFSTCGVSSGMNDRTETKKVGRAVPVLKHSTGVVP